MVLQKVALISNYFLSLLSVMHKLKHISFLGCESMQIKFSKGFIGSYIEKACNAHFIYLHIDI